MEPVKINEFKEPECTLYNPQGEVVGEITSILQFNDVRLQIREQNLKGYYVIWKNYLDGKEKVEISPFGRIENWPGDFCLNLLVALPEKSVPPAELNALLDKVVEAQSQPPPANIEEWAERIATEHFEEEAI